MMKNKATHILTKIAVNIGRLLMAITFIFSGFVKGIDPLGTQYKITDYLEALHIDWMFPSWSTLLMSIVLAMCEFAIGIFLLLAIRRKLVSKIALLVMSVMTLITLWIVIADPVKDCGCFGDAIVLTNMETFVKNLILLAIAILLWKKPQEMPQLVSKPTQWIAINYTFLFSIVMSIWSLWYHLHSGEERRAEGVYDRQLSRLHLDFHRQQDGSDRRRLRTSNPRLQHS